MRRIYHLTTRTAWEREPTTAFHSATLDHEGFLHCANADQVARAANRFHAAVDELVVLHIDVLQLSSPLKDEASSSGEVFPHIYGPLNRDAVCAVESMRRGTEGQWIFNA